MPMYFCCVGVCHLPRFVHCVVDACFVGCVPVVAWLNSIDGSRHLIWFSACWGVVDMLFTRVFVIGPVLPRRVGVGCC